MQERHLALDVRIVILRPETDQVMFSCQRHLRLAIFPKYYASGELLRRILAVCGGYHAFVMVFVCVVWWLCGSFLLRSRRTFLDLGKEPVHVARLITADCAGLS